MTTVRPTVQLGFGYSAAATGIVWTDATQFVKLGATAGISITRGAADELSETQTGTLTLELDNEDGRFSPGLAASPYYPNVKRNVPIRCLATVLGGINFLTDPGFESAAHGWAAGALAPASVALDPTHVRSGTNALKVGWTNSATGGVVQCPVYGLTIGVLCTASVYVWVPAGDPPVRLDIDGVTTGSASTLFDQFQRISVTWTSTAASHTVRLTTTVTSPVIGDVVWMDEAQVEEAPAPTAYSSTPATVHARYFGMVNNWPMKWAGLHSTVTITASDMFKWLARDEALQPMLVEEVLSSDPAVYYLLSESSDSTSAGDLSGNGKPSLTIGQAGVDGTLAFGEGIGPPSDGLGTPVFTPVSATAGKYLSTDIISPLNSQETGGTLLLECWFSTSTNGRVIFTWDDDSIDAFENSIRFLLESGTGKLVVGEKFGGNTATSVAATPSLSDGNVHHLVYDEAGQNVWVDGVSYAVTSPVYQDLRILTVGGYKGGDLWSGSISHVAAYVVQAGVPAVADIVGHYITGTTGHSGEDADDRITRLASYAGLPAAIGFGTFSPVASQGELGQTALAHMRAVELTEGGKLICDRATSGLLFQARTVRYTPTPVLTIAAADLETGDVELSDDDQKMINLVTATRPGGATQRVQSTASIAANGPYPQVLNVLKVSDADVVDAAWWTVIRYADPPPELRQVPVIASTLSTATYRAFLDADISTVFTVTDLPPEAPAPAQTVTVEGYTERITQEQHLLDFRVSRTDADSVWVLDDPVYSVLGSTTRLTY